MPQPQTRRKQPAQHRRNNDLNRETSAPGIDISSPCKQRDAKQPEAKPKRGKAQTPCRCSLLLSPSCPRFRMRQSGLPMCAIFTIIVLYTAYIHRRPHTRSEAAQSNSAVASQPRGPMFARLLISPVDAIDVLSSSACIEYEFPLD